MTKTLNDILPDWMTGGGLFAKLTTNFNVPWKNEVDGEVLDLDYHGNRSGEKILAPLLYKLLNDEGEIENANLLKLCNLIYIKYGQSWNKLWATLHFDYNPIENYKMTETETTDGTKAGTITTSGNKTNNGSKNGTLKVEGSDDFTGANSGTDSEETDNTTNGTNKDRVYGFNSSTAVPSDEGENNQTANTTKTGTTSLNITNNDEYSRTDTTAETTADTETTSGTQSENETTGLERELTRAGNIGVTTSQQMIESERQLWFWNFFNKVFEDVDTITVLQVFKNDLFRF